VLPLDRVGHNKWQEMQIELINTLHVDGFNNEDLPPKSMGRKQMDTIPYRIDTWGRWIQKGYEHDMKYTTQAILDIIKKKNNRDMDDTPTYPLASDVNYAKKLCRHNSTSVSRCNADCSGPDCCRSEGKVIILATVHDTFPKPKSKKTYWISFDSLETALQFRKEVALHNPTDLPISMEYMDRDAFDVIHEAGRVLGTLIKYIGTSSTMIRQLWNIKLYIEALPYETAPLWMDQLLFSINRFFPSILPKAIMEMGQQRDHHVIMTVGEFGNGNMARIIERMDQFARQYGTEKIQILECGASSSSNKYDAAALTAFRFVAAPAFRTWCVGHNLQGYSVDYALPKNGGATPPLYRNEYRQQKDATAIPIHNNVISTNNANATLPSLQPVKRMRYSHFACNVVHEDLAYPLGVDLEHAKHTFKHVIEQECAGKLPAEHGHGTEYTAPHNTQERWKKMDPLNVFNPGIGGLSPHFRYKSNRDGIELYPNI
jgi:D-lactate dehydrogenase (quinone)